MIEFIAPRAKTYAYLMENDKQHKEHKKAKGTKKCVMKRELILENYKNFVLNDETILKKHVFRSDHHCDHTLCIHCRN